MKCKVTVGLMLVTCVHAREQTVKYLFSSPGGAAVAQLSVEHEITDDVAQRQPLQQLHLRHLGAVGGARHDGQPRGRSRGWSCDEWRNAVEHVHI